MVSAYGGGGVCLGGVHIPLVHPLPIACLDTSPTPWTEFLTRASENITFPRLLLRAVTSFRCIYESQFAVRQRIKAKQGVNKLSMRCE